MNVKIAFLNGSLDKKIYVEQPEGFAKKEKEHLAYKLKRSVYGLKRTSRQWYLRFSDTITSFEFKKNTVDQCIYLKVSENKFIILVLYVDDILLTCNDLDLLHETKGYLAKNFKMIDLGEASNVSDIEIIRN